MLRPALAGLFVCLAASVVSAQVQAGDSPTFTAKALDGSTISPAKFKGKIIVIDFWATWCGPCMAEAPHMVELNKQYGDKGVQIIGVSLDQNFAKLKSTLPEVGFTWPQIFDQNVAPKTLSDQFGVDSIPRCFILDPTGQVAWTGHPANIDKHLAEVFKATPPQLVAPELIEQATKSMDAADAALATDALVAIKALADVPAEALAEAKVQERFDELQKKATTAADELMKAAEALVTEKSYVKALDRFRAIAKALPKQDIGKAAQKRLDELLKSPEIKAQMDADAAEQKATELLASAQQLQSQKKDEQAYIAFKRIVKGFPKTAAAKTAQDAVATYEKDPAFVKRAADAEAGSKAKSMLSLAQAYRSAGNLDGARRKYEELIATFPNTSFAETAKAELAAMK